jgi:hypothetical protein
VADPWAQQDGRHDEIAFHRNFSSDKIPDYEHQKPGHQGEGEDVLGRTIARKRRDRSDGNPC